jgi:lipid II isoglutaminyl synthase (glutamine-hydrolysing)
VADSRLGIVSLYPDLLGTYGDRGNAAVLAHRARRRGISVDVVEVAPGDPVPTSGDVYLLGGGEDEAQAEASNRLRSGGELASAVTSGAAVLAVCAGLQLLGDRFAGSDGADVAGLGLVDATTIRRPQPRAVGEILTDPDPALRLSALTGYENHAGGTVLGPGARALGKVRLGIGNGDGSDGCWQGRVVGTYLHGPVLARNPALADLLLSWSAGDLPPLVDPLADALHADRLRAAERVGAAKRLRWWRGGR